MGRRPAHKEQAQVVPIDEPPGCPWEKGDENGSPNAAGNRRVTDERRLNPKLICKSIPSFRRSLRLQGRLDQAVVSGDGSVPAVLKHRRVSLEPPNPITPEFVVVVKGAFDFLRFNEIAGLCGVSGCGGIDAAPN